MVVGELLGAVGDAEGTLDGILGLELGRLLGSVGYELGTDVGELGWDVGDAEGTPVGSAVGTLEGMNDVLGLWVGGVIVGACDGPGQGVPIELPVVIFRLPWLFL